MPQKEQTPDTRVLIGLMVPPELREWLVALAETEGRSISNMGERLLAEARAGRERKLEDGDAA